MEEPTLEERKRWWLLVYARTSFHHASESCALLLERVASTGDPLYLPLAIAVFALYGRPFKRQNEVGKLDTTYVPAAWTATHNGMITFRDKLLVHTDGDRIPQAGRALHNVTYCAVAGRLLFSSADIRPEIQAFEQIAQYLQAITCKVLGDLDLLYSRFRHLMPMVEGVGFELSLKPGPLFVPWSEPPSVATLDFNS